MESAYPKTTEFVANPPSAPNTFFESFVYEPENIEEERLGFLYILGQIESIEGRARGASLLNFIAAEVSREFFKKKGFMPKDALEKTLSELNPKINTAFEEKQAEDWLREINLAIILVSPEQGELCFSLVGETQGFLWRKGQFAEISQNFAGKENVSLAKLFKSVASGKVFSGDKIIFSVPNITRFASKDRLRQSIDKTLGWGEQNFKSFAGIDDNLALSFILISIKPNKEILQPRPVPDAPKTSPLPSPTQEKKSVSAPILKESVKSSQKIFAFIKKVCLVGAGLTSYFLAKKLYPTLRKITKISFEKSRSFIKKKQYVKFKPSFRKIAQPKLFLANLKKRRLDKRYLYLLLSLLLLILVPIFFSLIKFTRSPDPSRDLPSNILRLTDLKNLTLSFEPRGIALVNQENLLLFDATGFYLFNPKNNQGQFALGEIDTPAELILQAELKDAFVYLDNARRILTITPDLVETETASIEGLNKETLLDIAGFENNLYALTSSGKIIKYANLNFSTPIVWMDKTSDFGSNYLSLAIDGSIYVLEKSGLIHRYNSGKIDQEYLITVEGMAGEGDKIFTRPGSNYLYLLSQSQQKIIIFDKESQLLARQISLAPSENRKSFYLSPDEKTIYLLDGYVIYKISLE